LALRDMRRSAGILVLEGLVVVISILLAFALDAWWGRRAADAEMDQELASVRRELETNRLLISNEINALERITAASAALVDELAASSGAQVVSVPDTLAFLVASWAPSLDASFGAIDALISSGRLAGVENEELRLGLARLRGRVADAVEDELAARQISLDHQWSLFMSRMDLRAVVRVEDAFFGAAEQSFAGVSMVYRADLDFPNSQAVLNSLVNRASWYASALGELRGLLRDVDILIELAP
jgi:hypothetical protein